MADCRRVAWALLVDLSERRTLTASRNLAQLRHQSWQARRLRTSAARRPRYEPAGLPTLEVREALALHYLAEMSVEEISIRLGAPEGTIKARLSRGREALGVIFAGALLHDRSTDND